MSLSSPKFRAFVHVEDAVAVEAGVYFILGNMDEMSRHFIQHLVDVYQAKVIVVGRDALDEENRNFLNTEPDALEYLQVDVTQDTTRDLLMKYLQVKYPTIHAVFELVMTLPNTSVDSAYREALCRGLKSQHRYIVPQHQPTELPPRSQWHALTPPVREDGVPQIQRMGLSGVNHFVRRLVHALKEKHVFDSNRMPKYARLMDYLNQLPDSPLHVQTVEQLLEVCCEQDTYHAAYYHLCYQCYLHYDAILTGVRTPKDVLYSDEGLRLFKHFYSDSPESRYCNQRIGHYVAKYLKNNPRRIKILELGAGVGATTKALIDVLRGGEGIDYCYSDVEPSFLREVKTLQQQVAFNLYAERIDIDNLTTLADGAFDIVIASNTLHLARDVLATLKEIKRIIRPHGIFLLNEAIKEQPYLVFIFGLLDEWWQVATIARLNASPLLHQFSWRQQLMTAGFTFPEMNQLNKGGVQCVFYCPSLPQDEEFTYSKPNVRSDEKTPLNSEKMLYQLMESILDIPARIIKPTDTFFQLGFNSLTLTELAESLSQYHQIQIIPSQFFELKTIGQLQDYLDSNKGLLHQNRNRPSLEEDREESQMALKDKIVICGYYGSFAQCPTPAHFWQALLSGKDCTQMLVRERFKNSQSSIKHMGLIADYAQFDYNFFDMSREEAQHIDPQHCKLLELSWHVFEQSGVSPLSLKGGNVGVFIAIQCDDGAVNGYAPSCAANRITHFFDFHGPSKTIDTANANSFSALDQAVQAIHAGQCETALVLGVGLTCDENTLVHGVERQVLSPSHRCRPFDTRADGYVMGEGVAGIWLMSEMQAQTRGLRAYASIGAIHVNQDAVLRLLMDVYHSDGLSADDIDYVEAHAVALYSEDPIEYAALQEIFKHRTKPLFLGSLKSNIGHTGAVAGFAGILKGLLMLEHQLVPPQANFRDVNEYIDLQSGTFEIAKHVQSTPLSKIAINCFGSGGRNGHCVLLRCPSGASLASPLRFAYVPIKLSAKTKAGLERLQQQLLHYLNAATQPVCLTQLSFTLNVGRADFAWRKTLLVEHEDDLKQQLQQSNLVYLPDMDASIRQQTLGDFYQSTARLKKYLSTLAHAYQQGQIIDWRHLYLGMDIVPLALPVYPFALTPCWFVPPVEVESVRSMSATLACYEPVWCKTECSRIDLSDYHSIVVFLTHSQQQWVKEEFQQARCNRKVHYIFVDNPLSLEEDMRWFLEHDCDLIYYFAGMFIDELSTFSLLASQKWGVESFLNLVKQLHQFGYAQKTLTLYVYSNNAYAFDSRSINPFATSLHGLAQSLKKEYPAWRIECVDITADTAPLQSLTVSSQGLAYPLVLARNSVWHRQLKPLDRPFSPSMMTQSSHVLVLIGGDGEMGKQLVAEFIKQSPRAIIIASRRAILRTEGLLQWKPLDCTNSVAVDLFIEDLIAQYGKIDCLYHLVSHYAESPIVSLSYDDYHFQMRAKVLGTYHLMSACEDKNVTQVIIVSSLQVYAQSKHRGAYTAACFYADAIMDAMRSQKTKRVHWGAWHKNTLNIHHLPSANDTMSMTIEQCIQALQVLLVSDKRNLSFMSNTDAMKGAMPLSPNSIEFTLLTKEMLHESF